MIDLIAGRIRNIVDADDSIGRSELSDQMVREFPNATDDEVEAALDAVL